MNKIQAYDVSFNSYSFDHAADLSSMIIATRPWPTVVVRRKSDYWMSG